MPQYGQLCETCFGLYSSLATVLCSFCRGRTHDTCFYKQLAFLSLLSLSYENNKSYMKCVPAFRLRLS